jgi:putative Mg2+ transporter-C (MgtC) family protein
MLKEFLEQTFIDPSTIIFRLVLSLILGGLIGWERESRRQPAGLRTHILICIGSTLLMLTSIFIPQTFENFQNGDPGRIAAQVVSGIGFLGGGAIFKLGANIRGLTTAATIWAVAAIGLTIGAGAYVGAIIATLLILFVLIVMDKVENRYFPELSLKILQLNFSSAKMETDIVFAIMERYGIIVQSVNIAQSLNKKNTKMKFIIHVPKKLDLKKFYKELNGLNNIAQIALGQDF